MSEHLEVLDAEEQELIDALTDLISMGYLDVVEEDGVDEIRFQPTLKVIGLYREGVL
jgi:hypothetical protein